MSRARYLPSIGPAFAKSFLTARSFSRWDFFPPEVAMASHSRYTSPRASSSAKNEVCSFPSRSFSTAVPASPSAETAATTASFFLPGDIGDRLVEEGGADPELEGGPVGEDPSHDEPYEDGEIPVVEPWQLVCEEVDHLEPPRYRLEPFADLRELAEEHGTPFLPRPRWPGHSLTLYRHPI